MRKHDEALAGIDDGCEPWLVEGAQPEDGFVKAKASEAAEGGSDGQR